MIEDFYKLEPYDLDKTEKNEMLTSELVRLTREHGEKCQEYKRFLDTVGYQEENVSTIADIPFYPVRMFKEYELSSIPKDEVFKVMTSSGTTGQRVSKIIVDKETAMIQQKVMIKILSDYWGKKRLPMLIVDTPAVLKDRKMFSARGAAILGLQVAAREMVYVLNDDMSLNTGVLDAFFEKYPNQPFIIFGFTFMVWKHFYKELVRLKDEVSFDLSNGILIHGGGWKKLVNEAVSPEEFHRRLKDICGLDSVHDYYGMVEQTGCIYMQCECGHLHASIFSDVIIRKPEDFSICKKGERGIIQVVSAIPESYPGHSLLTEDEGEILGEDDCPCGRKGKYFKIYGRLKNAEIRGCSDTYAAKFK